MRGWRRTGWAGGLCLVVGLFVGVLPAGGQEGTVATPGTADSYGLPAVPAPEECRVAPRTFDDLTSLSATPMTLEELDPATPPAGLDQAPHADEATARAVVAVVRESIACSNAGDLLRGFALLSDGYLRRRVIVDAGPFTQELFDTIAVPTPLPAGRYITFVAVGPVVIIPDGRAAVEVIASDVRTRRSLVLLIETPAGWRIDEFMPLEDSAAPAGTPAAATSGGWS